MKLYNHRKFYSQDTLSIENVGNNPMEFFIKWYKDAKNSDKIVEAKAMTVSTGDKENTPSSRDVL